MALAFGFVETMRLSPALLELDGMVVNIELTLSSIVQGVALTFLAENTREVFSLGGAAHWPYVIAGLFIIFIFWSRSILHTLTLIRWPLEFGHNFLYIGCTLWECLLFTRLTNPHAWFGLSALYAVWVWFLFAYDLRMTNVREADRPSEASRELCQLIERDQLLNIRFLLPVLFLFNLACALAIHFRPGFFIAREYHVYLGLAQMIGLALYLYYVMRFFGRTAPFVLQRQEERRALAAPDR